MAAPAAAADSADSGLMTTVGDYRKREGFDYVPLTVARWKRLGNNVMFVINDDHSILPEEWKHLRSWDVLASEDLVLKPNERRLVDLGFGLSIPSCTGITARFSGRAFLNARYGIVLAGGDQIFLDGERLVVLSCCLRAHACSFVPGYTESCFVRLWNSGSATVRIKKGAPIAHLQFAKALDLYTGQVYVHDYEDSRGGDSEFYDARC